MTARMWSGHPITFNIGFIAGQDTNTNTTSFNTHDTHIVYVSKQQLTEYLKTSFKIPSIEASNAEWVGNPLGLWCLKNCKYPWNIILGNTICNVAFNSRADAMLFKLTWC